MICPKITARCASSISTRKINSRGFRRLHKVKFSVRRLKFREHRTTTVFQCNDLSSVHTAQRTALIRHVHSRTLGRIDVTRPFRVAAVRRPWDGIRTTNERTPDE